MNEYYFSYNFVKGTKNGVGCCGYEIEGRIDSFEKILSVVKEIKSQNGFDEVVILTFQLFDKSVTA